MRALAFLEQAAQDVRYACRTMAANPLFTATAALSLALGIGANTAIYSFMDAVLLRTLPVTHPEQLVVAEWHSSGRSPVVRSVNGTMRRYGSKGSLSPNFPYAAYDLFRSNQRVFSTFFAYTYSRPFNLVIGGQAETVRGSFVSGNFASGLGVPPAAGRMLDPNDDVPGAPPNLVLSYAYWQRRFGGNPSAIGQSILVSGQPYTIVGVAAPGFFGVDPGASPSFYLAMHKLPSFMLRPDEEERRRFLDNNFYWIEMMGRLRPGVTLAQAQAVLGAQFRAFAASTAAKPEDAKILPELALEEGGSGLDSLRRQYSKPLFILMTMVGLILAIACANLANLLLARSSARRREMAVRLSLGAGRARILRQMLTESVCLSVLGGVLGLAVGYSGVQFITWLLANGREDFTLRASLNWPVLGFTFALSLLAGMLFGLAPAVQATRTDHATALKESRAGQPRGHRILRIRLGHLLVAGQMAVSLLLIIGAGLFVRTLTNLHSVELGFNRENLLLFSLNGRQAGYKDAALARFYAGLLDRMREIPGVRSATLSDFPLVAQYMDNNSISIPGRSPKAADPYACLLRIDPAFLDTMQIPVLSGRNLQQGDLASPQVAVVNQKFASAYFDGQNPVGRQFSFGKSQPMYQIVGMARAAHYNSIQEDIPPVIYLPYTDEVANLQGMFFELRTVGNPMAALSAVRRIVHDASHDVSITDISTEEQMIDRTIADQRTFANLGTCFALLALLIASVGLYGAMAYAVARRTNEIGIRMALGAQRPRIIWMVLREVMAIAAAGLLVGFGAARLTTKFVESYLFGIKHNDPLALAGAIAILLAAAVTAGYLPAWRASRIDPAEALRNE